MKFFPFSSLLYCLFSYFLYKTKFISIASLHRYIFQKLFAKQQSEIIDFHAKIFVDQYVHTMIYQAAFECLYDAKSKGHEIAILSSSPSFLVAHFARHFEVKDYAGTVYQIDPQGRFSRLGPLMLGESKKKYVEEYLNRMPGTQVTAFSDSFADLPLLEFAHTAIGVNPDTDLLKHCKKNNWAIL